MIDGNAIACRLMYALKARGSAMAVRPPKASLKCNFADRQDLIIRRDFKEHVTGKKGGPWRLPEAAFHLSNYALKR